MALEYSRIVQLQLFEYPVIPPHDPRPNGKIPEIGVLKARLDAVVHAGGIETLINSFVILPTRAGSLVR